MVPQGRPSLPSHAHTSSARHCPTLPLLPRDRGPFVAPLPPKIDGQRVALRRISLAAGTRDGDALVLHLPFSETRYAFLHGGSPCEASLPVGVGVTLVTGARHVILTVIAHVATTTALHGISAAIRRWPIQVITLTVTALPIAR